MIGSLRSRRSTVLALLTSLSLVGSAGAQTVVTSVDEGLQERLLRAQRIASIEADKAGFVNTLIDRWTEEAARQGRDAFVPKGTRRLMAKNAADLLQLSERANDFDTFHKLVFEGYTIDTFGQLTQELVFYPIAACRIYDSRSATGGLAGPMAPGTQRDVSVNDSTSTQGGANPDCSVAVPDLNNDPPALAITLTAASPTGPGNLRTFAAGGAVPNAAMLTYTAGTTISTGTVTASCTSCGTELTVRNQGAGNTDVVIDVVGYFHAPLLQTEDCTVVTTTANPAVEGTVNLTSTCAAGYVVTGGGAGSNLISTPNPGMVWFQTEPAGQGWSCRGQNHSPVGLAVECHAVCCRIPGR